MEVIDRNLQILFTRVERIEFAGSLVRWKATAKDANEQVEVKKHFRLFLDPEAARLVYRELYFLQAVGDHDSVVGIRNVLYSSTSLDLYVCYPYTEIDLQTAVLSASDITIVIKQLLLVLVYLHSAGLRHGAVEPHNVLLTAEGQVKLKGFHRCCSTSERCTGDSELTLDGDDESGFHQPPEVSLGCVRYASTSEDIWAMGVLLYELLTDRVLFPASPLMDHLERVVQVLGAPSPPCIAALGDACAVTMVTAAVSAVCGDGGDGSGGCSSGSGNSGIMLPELLDEVDPVAAKMVTACLKFLPGERATALDLLQYEWFDELRHPDPEEEAKLIVTFPGGPLHVPAEVSGPALTVERYRALIRALGDEIEARNRVVADDC